MHGALFLHAQDQTIVTKRLHGSTNSVRLHGVAWRERLSQLVAVRSEGAWAEDSACHSPSPRRERMRPVQSMCASVRAIELRAVRANIRTTVRHGVCSTYDRRRHCDACRRRCRHKQAWSARYLQTRGYGWGEGIDALQSSQGHGTQHTSRAPAHKTRRDRGNGESSTQAHHSTVSAHSCCATRERSRTAMRTADVDAML